ncbi:hypothetical protein CRUP_026287, partial [Coryphaenoides rupestris]
CFSSLGRIGDRQLISLQKFGCVQHGIVQHEVLHALGFYHEHTRSDRDQHILIHWDNIKDFNSRHCAWDLVWRLPTWVPVGWWVGHPATRDTVTKLN